MLYECSITTAIKDQTHFSSWLISMICETRSSRAAKSLSNASCFFFKAYRNMIQHRANETKQHPGKLCPGNITRDVLNQAKHTQQQSIINWTTNPCDLYCNYNNCNNLCSISSSELPLRYYTMATYKCSITITVTIVSISARS